jgi:hypothetical protein
MVVLVVNTAVAVAVTAVPVQETWVQLVVLVSRASSSSPTRALPYSRALQPSAAPGVWS